MFNRKSIALWWLAAVLFVALPGQAQDDQQSTIAGQVYDAASGNPIPQIKVVISGPVTVEALTNADGTFRVDVPPGTYRVRYSGEKHPTMAVEGLVATIGEIADASTVLSSATDVTEIDVIGAAAPRIATAETMLVERQLAETISDSISGAEIRQGTASDAASALKKVTGVSVVNDRFIYVRGLGERYSATTLNNAMLATTEPERRVVPLDMFPAALIDNIKVLKTYSPDLPGEFSAGLVQIETTEFPSAPTMSVSYSAGFNTNTHFRDDFLAYAGGGRDSFGFDDGTRALPGSIPRDTRVDRTNFSREELQGLGREFSNNWELVRRNRARPSQTFNFVAGNTFGKLGVVGAITFSNKLNSIFDQDRIFYQPNPDAARGLANAGPPLPENVFVYDESAESVRLGGVLNVSYQMTPSHKLSYRNFLSRDTDDSARSFSGFHQDFETSVRNQRLRFVERSLFNTQLEGDHLFSDLKNSILTWRLSYSLANRDEPDLRESLYLLNDRTGAFEFFDDSQSAFRMFNTQEEKIWNPSVAWLVPFFGDSFSGSIKGGADFSFRKRDFRSRRFRLALRGSRGLDITAPPNELFAPENINPRGFELSETTRITDAYQGTRDVFGYFGMVDLSFAQRWRVISGLRIEDVDQDVVTFDPFDSNRARQPSPFNAVDYLPSANVIYSLTPRQNLRFGFSQTVSRPDFRELALFDFLDIVGGRNTVGNPELVETKIRNYDARWEFFPGGNQLLAASFFYKRFDNPIERTIRATVGLLTSFDNADSARNFGFEAEFRRGLGFVSSRLREFALSSNFTFVDSTIDLREVQNTVITNRRRPMQGQSRYVANVVGEWARPRWRSTSRFYVNYFSSRITDVGFFGLPDVVQQGVTTLDFVYELNIKENGRWKMQFSAENLSDANWQWTQGGLPFQRWRLGRTFEIGTSFQIF